MTYAQRIHHKLSATFQPTDLSVMDESHKHAGHSGARPEGETHFQVRIVSTAFTGLSRVARHQAVYRCLEAELREHVHALAIIAHTPEEAVY